MLDRHLHPRIKPLLHQCVRVLDKPGITPDGLTLVGFAIGVLALPFLALGWYLAALVVILLNRLLDGLDGALARRRGLTDAGGFLDISLDFLFYALVPFGFILAAPQQNALAGGWLLFAFIGTGSSFLAFAALAAKHQIDNPGYAHKSFYYLGGLWPTYFSSKSRPSQRASRNEHEEASVAAINESSVPKSGPKTIPPAITSMLPGNSKRVAMMNNRI